MIDMARETDQADIAQLWAVCFGDSAEYIAHFLKKRFSASRCLVFRDSGQIVSMMFLLEGRLQTAGRQRTAYYIYAACTHPQYRNRGIMAALIERAREEASALGAGALCLVPSEASLFDYYARFGFRTFFEKKIIKVQRQTLQLLASDEPVALVPDNGAIADIRTRALEQTDAFLWDEPAVAYASDEALFNGLAVAAGNRNDCYAFIETKGDIAVAREALCLQGCLPSLASLLLRMSQASKFQIHLPVSFPLSADNCREVPNGMMMELNGVPERISHGLAYIGLTLE
ncbi:MAG TPA: GNAT family N-acetyltransferase [Clostridiales bacterium]|nr:GNAT family N-acetyltransferase [Clostridiales bacterium]HQK73166.1 GNAT family N-acetyltransferase [Clostridiales bacterium]